MKFVFAVALLCIGAVAAQTSAPVAQNSGRLLAESLEKRADALLQRVRAAITEHKVHNFFLIQGLEHQAVLIEALHLDLKTQLANKDFIHHLHHIHVIEEDLLHLENRVSEELAIIAHVAAGNDNRGETGAQLVARGQQLVKDAQAAVAKKPNAPEAREINSTVIVVEALVKAIQAKPAPTPADLQKDEQELARQERSLRQLIEKLNARKN